MTTIEHDPDRGCTGCPFLRSAYDNLDERDLRTCEVDGREPGYEPRAPAWCPLRAGPVVMRTPGERDET